MCGASHESKRVMTTYRKNNKILKVDMCHTYRERKRQQKENENAKEEDKREIEKRNEERK